MVNLTFGLFPQVSDSVAHGPLVIVCKLLLKPKGESA